mmetsp:Transcript_1135/g.1579  ORF Transcript_1135/g.1579 Transcript_1135/m.1579 type:complete len:615 (+) Transcript_1135:108-1952(+)
MYDVFSTKRRRTRVWVGIVWILISFGVMTTSKGLSAVFRSTKTNIMPRTFFRVRADAQSGLRDKTQIFIDDDDTLVIRRLQRGVKKVAKLIGTTIGPRGRNVVLGVEPSSSEPSIVNDGITIAERVKLDDPIENLGAQMILDAGAKTNNISGDGTSTSMVLAANIIDQGHRVIMAGANPREVCTGIDMAEKESLKIIKELVKPALPEHLDRIALSASGYDAEGSKALLKAFEEVKSDGVIKIGRSNTGECSTKLIEGWQYKRGFIKPELANSEDETRWTSSDPYVLLVNDPIVKPQDMIGVLKWAQEGGHPLLIMAEDYSPQAITGITMAKVRGGMDVCAIRAPGMTTYNEENLEDIAILSNATVLDEVKGTSLKKDFHPDILGRLKAVEVSKDGTQIFGDGKRRELLESRANSVRADLRWLRDRFSKGDPDGSVEDAIREYRERLGRLTSGICVVEIGANTAVEMRERMLRIEDALCAVRSAQKEGVLAGGGATLVGISKKLEELAKTVDDEETRLGIRIFSKALKEPTQKIAENAGYNGEVVVQKITNIQDTNGLEFGWDAQSDEVVNLYDRGVIDSAESIRCAIENSASVARAFLTIKGIVRDRIRVKAGV